MAPILPSPHQARGEIDPREWRFLLAGPTSSTSVRTNPAPAWLTDKTWVELSYLASLPNFAGFDQHLSLNVDHYKAIFDSNEVC